MKTLNTKIEVIAYFPYEKQPLPLKFKMNGKSIPIDKIISAEKQMRAGEEMFVFECQSEIDNDVKRYVLKYSISKCTWYLFKF